MPREIAFRLAPTKGRGARGNYREPTSFRLAFRRSVMGLLATYEHLRSGESEFLPMAPSLAVEFDICKWIDQNWRTPAGALVMWDTNAAVCVWETRQIDTQIPDEDL